MTSTSSAGRSPATTATDPGPDASTPSANTNPKTGGTSEVKRLRDENAKLREQLEALGGGEVSSSMHRVEPSYAMSEGERQEIELRGSAVSPFTGELRTADELPAGVDVDQSDRAKEDGKKAKEREERRLAAADGVDTSTQHGKTQR